MHARAASLAIEGARGAAFLAFDQGVTQGSDVLLVLLQEAKAGADDGIAAQGVAPVAANQNMSARPLDKAPAAAPPPTRRTGGSREALPPWSSFLC